MQTEGDAARGGHRPRAARAAQRREGGDHAFVRAHGTGGWHVESGRCNRHLSAVDMTAAAVNRLFFLVEVFLLEKKEVTRTAGTQCSRGPGSARSRCGGRAS